MNQMIHMILLNLINQVRRNSLVTRNLSNITIKRKTKRIGEHIINIYNYNNDDEPDDSSDPSDSSNSSKSSHNHKIYESYTPPTKTASLYKRTPLPVSLKWIINDFEDFLSDFVSHIGQQHHLQYILNPVFHSLWLKHCHNPYATLGLANQMNVHIYSKICYT